MRPFELKPSEYLVKKHQSTTIRDALSIYLICNIVFLIGSFFLPFLDNLFILPLFYIPFLVIYHCTKKEKWTQAGILLIITLNVTLWTVTLAGNLHIGTCFAVTAYPFVARQAVLEKKFYIFNGISNITAIIVNLYLYDHIPWRQMTPQQQAELVGIYIFPITIYVVSFYVSAVLNKNLRTSAKLLESNAEKSEEISRELMRILESKDNFLSSFSTEIRHFLNPINESIDWLISKVKDDAQLDVLRNARLGGKMVMTFVNNLIDAFRLHSQRVEFSVSKACPSDIVAQALAITRESILKKQLFVRALISKDVPNCLMIDSSKILQILMNLISNSMKFTNPQGKIILFMNFYPPNPKVDLLKPMENSNLLINDSVFQFETGKISQANKSTILETPQGKPQSSDVDETDFEEPPSLIHTISIQKRKTLQNVEELNRNISDQYQILDANETGSVKQKTQSLRTHCGFLKFQLTDTGAGISSEQIDKIFNVPSHPFGKTSTQKHEFSLWLCKQLCVKMGGNMTAYSETKKGTSIVFYIPVNAADDDTNLRVQPLPTKNLPRALVVDDEMYNREMYNVILKKRGADVIMANDGKQALEYFMREPEGYFDFVFMDINMPVMDGVTCVREMRKFENKNRKEHVDVYFISANYEYSHLESNSDMKSEKNAKTKFIRKPIELQMIGTIISEYLPRYQKTQPIEVAIGNKQWARNLTAPAAHDKVVQTIRHKLLDDVKSAL